MASSESGWQLRLRAEEFSAVPIVSIVVPFWGYLLGSFILGPFEGYLLGSFILGPFEGYLLGSFILGPFEGYLSGSFIPIWLNPKEGTTMETIGRLEGF